MLKVADGVMNSEKFLVKGSIPGLRDIELLAEEANGSPEWRLKLFQNTPNTDVRSICDKV